MTPSRAVTRGPTTSTLRAIEAILRRAAAPLSRYEIRKALGGRVGAPLLDEALDYMAGHEMVYDEGSGGKVVWIRQARPNRQPPQPSKQPTTGRPRNLAALVRRHRRQILDIAAQHGVASVRLFGSAARGDDDDKSDVDLLVRLEPGRSLLDHIAFAQDVEEVLGIGVDVVSEGGISPYIRDAVLKEAVPV